MSKNVSSADGRARAALALHRFGFGPRPGDIERITSDPRGALLAELKTGPKIVNDSQLASSADDARATIAFRQERKRAREARQTAAAGSSEMAAPHAAENSGENEMKRRKPGPPLPRQIYLSEGRAHFQAAIDSDIGLVERLVWFWSNHFCVSADKGLVRSLCGAYEREAIRPHVLGRFSDMLLAAETHPAMLLYLDNARSFGPDSVAGMRRRKGLNENLAREIMELHTLGVRTGYTQEDVTNFAKVITGWSMYPPARFPERGGEFQFNARMHEPGAQTVLGKSYGQGGFEQGRAVLQMLAHHPSTAKHIAFKLARHFVADDPPAPLVERLARRFQDTGGDLMQVTQALVASSEAWSARRTKLKRPGEWTVAAMRASGLQIEDVRRIVNTQNLLGEPLWRPPAPKGFSDESGAWIDGLAQRLDVANQVGRLVGNDGSEPDMMLDAALGPLASTETRQAVQRAESRPQALALLLMAPEFQRR
jgi:uncharacterized protein (DUF1800 family)